MQCQHRGWCGKILLMDLFPLSKASLAPTCVFFAPLSAFILLLFPIDSVCKAVAKRALGNCTSSLRQKRQIISWARHSQCHDIIVQHFLNLHVSISWQVQHFVHLQVQISLDSGQPEYKMRCGETGKERKCCIFQWNRWLRSWQVKVYGTTVARQSRVMLGSCSESSLRL